MTTATLVEGRNRSQSSRRTSRIEYRIAFILICVLLAAALLYPIGTVFMQSVLSNGEFTLGHWTTLLVKPSFRTMIGNSFFVSGLAALCSALIAFFAAYGLTFSNVSPKIKRLMHIVLLLPLFLPSITYGFAVIYSFGRMGLVSQLIGQLPFSIYGFWGLLIADTVYTCLLYTSPSPRDRTRSRMPSSA